jgi:hypothetical protein
MGIKSALTESTFEEPPSPIRLDSYQQQWTLRRIAQELNRLNIRPARGRQWYASSVSNQLSITAPVTGRKAQIGSASEKPGWPQDVNCSSTESD